MHLHLRKNPPRRHGGVYIAVLGTALIASVLALTAVALQRLQIRQITAASDIRQAQLNAESAVELALLAMAQDDDWRTNKTNGAWFTNKDIGSGSATVEVTDPLDNNLANNRDESVRIRATGYHGALAGSAPRTEAQQLIELILDPVRDPLECLREVPQYQELPEWAEVIDYYQANGTQIDIDILGPPQIARNRQLEYPELTPAWTGEIVGSGFPVAEIARVDFANPYLAVSDRQDGNAGAAHRVGEFIKPSMTYTATVKVRPTSLNSHQYRISFYGNAGSHIDSGNGIVLNSIDTWHTLDLEFDVPNWTADQLKSAFIIVHSESGTSNFHVDDLSVVENTTDKYIYRQLLSPNHNPFGGAPNTNGIYWIDCEGNNLVIERSRIYGTLVVLNPGPESRIVGPVHWSPFAPGYPALVVHNSGTDFVMRGTDQALREEDNAINYNPLGAPYDDDDFLGDSEDGDRHDEFPSQLRGLVAVFGDLTYDSSPSLTGPIVAGGDINGMASLPANPPLDSLLSPPPGFYKYRYEPRRSSVTKAVQP